MKGLGKTCFLVCEVVPCDWDEKQRLGNVFFAVIGFYTDTVLWTCVCFSSLHKFPKPFLDVTSLLRMLLVHSIDLERLT